VAPQAQVLPLLFSFLNILTMHCREMYQQQIQKELPFGKKTMRRLASLQHDAVKHSVQQLDVTALSGHVQWDLQNPNR
jgi:hypothetical protein